MPPLLTADAPGVGFAAGSGQWGIFAQSGQQIIAVDSVDSIEYDRDYRVSDYPQEQGAFQSYNKVQVPFQAKVGFLISSTRTDFLNAIEAACASLDLVAVVTPEISYPSANLTHYGYRRDGQSGRSLIRVDVWCEEIRFASAAAFGNSQSNNAAPSSPNGPAQASPTTQNAPAPSGPGIGNGNIDTPSDAGGGFSQAPNTVVASPVGTPTSFGPTTGSASTGTVTTIPPGIPNDTGGGASSLSTPLSGYTDPFATGGF